VSAWQDHCELECDQTTLEALDIVSDSESQTLTVSSQPNFSSDSITKICITVPQSIDLAISGDELTCVIRNKIEGDVSIECSAGSLEVDKIRGVNVSLQLGRASLRVNKLLEGNVSVSADSVAAKMLNGDVVHITSSGSGGPAASLTGGETSSSQSGVSIEAIYAPRCHIISTSGDITLGGVHSAAAVVHAHRGNISVSGIDGCLDVLADEGNVTLQINRLQPGSQTVARAIRGGIQARINPEQAADLRCESQGIAGRARVTVVADETAFERHEPRNAPFLAVGKLTGRSASGADTVVSSGRANRSGKIDLQGAKPDANSDFGSSSGSGTGFGSGTSAGLPSLTLTARGHVRLETLSWFEAIRRKYGFTDAAQGTKPGSPGRAASAGARAKALAAEPTTSS